MKRYLTLVYFLLFLLSAILALTATAYGSESDEVALIEQEAQAQAFDPDLAVAIATVESNLNPKAVGALGEQGLFQLRPEFHSVVVGDTRHNVRIAIRYLSHLRVACGPNYGSAYFVCFNTGPYRKLRAPTHTEYYRRVSAIYRERVTKRLRKQQQGIEVKPYVAQD